MTATCIGFLFYFVCESAPPVPTDSYCKIARPIFWSARDTRRTKEQVDTENRKWKSLCGATK